MDENNSHRTGTRIGTLESRMPNQSGGGGVLPVVTIAVVFMVVLVLIPVLIVLPVVLVQP